MDMKRDHYEDIRLFSSGVVLVWFLISMGLLIAFPFVALAFGKNYWIRVPGYPYRRFVPT